MLILKHATKRSTEQTSTRTKWFKHIATEIVQEHLLNPQCINAPVCKANVRDVFICWQGAAAKMGTMTVRTVQRTGTYYELSRSVPPGKTALPEQQRNRNVFLKAAPEGTERRIGKIDQDWKQNTFFWGFKKKKQKSQVRKGKKKPKHKVFGRDIPGTSGTQTSGYPGQKLSASGIFLLF